MTTYVIQKQNPQTHEWADHIHFPDEDEARTALRELLNLKSSRTYGLVRPAGSSVTVVRLVSRTDTVLVPLGEDTV